MRSFIHRGLPVFVGLLADYRDAFGGEGKGFFHFLRTNSKVRTMAFDGSEGGQISLSLGAEMTAAYRSSEPNARKGHFYGREILRRLLDQQGCEGIRIYYGIDAEGNKELVLVGADSHENDMLDLVADVSTPCPNRCGIANKLNS